MEGKMIKEELLSIGKMAEINGVSIPTLRLYDKNGLLVPAYVDESSGYRYYTLQQTARLDVIAYMKELGMSLNEIKKVLEKEDVTIIEDILAQKNEQMHEQMRRLKERHDAVERAIAQIERYRKSPTTGTTSLEYIDRRYIWSIDCPVNFYEKDRNSYEEIVLALRKELLANGISQVHSYNLGTSIKQEDFESGRFLADKAFIFSDKSIEDHSGSVTTIDSGMFACIYLDNYDDEVEYGKQLLDFCVRHNYKICGDYLCEEMTEFHVFDENKRNMFLRLQVPVKFS